MRIIAHIGRLLCRGIDAWRVDVEQTMRAEEDHPVLLSHVAKDRSLMPSLALHVHLIDGVAGGTTGPVAGAAAARAIAWCAYLHGHARRLYASVTDMARVAAALLAAKLTHGRLPSPFTARDVYRNEWTGLTDANDFVAVRFRSRGKEVALLARNDGAKPARAESFHVGHWPICLSSLESGLKMHGSFARVSRDSTKSALGSRVRPDSRRSWRCCTTTPAQSLASSTRRLTYLPPVTSSRSPRGARLPELAARRGRQRPPAPRRAGGLTRGSSARHPAGHGDVAPLVATGVGLPTLMTASVDSSRCCGAWGRTRHRHHGHGARRHVANRWFTGRRGLVLGLLTASSATASSCSCPCSQAQREHPLITHAHQGIERCA